MAPSDRVLHAADVDRDVAEEDLVTLRAKGPSSVSGRLGKTNWPSPNVQSPPLPTLLLVEDSGMMCDLIREIIEKLGIFTWAGSFNRVVSGARYLAEHPCPDMILLDLALPDGCGWILVDVLKQHRSPPRIVLFSARRDQFTLYHASFLPVVGFIDKTDFNLASWQDGLRKLAAGRRYYSPSIHEEMNRFATSTFCWPKYLSPQEQRLLPLLAAGASNEQIGLRLKIAPATAQTHRKAIMGKLGLHSSVELTVWCRRVGVPLPLPDESYSRGCSA